MFLQVRQEMWSTYFSSGVAKAAYSAIVVVFVKKKYAMWYSLIVATSLIHSAVTLW